jgi:hypothetical protein
LKTKDEGIYQSFYASLLEMNVPVHKLVSVTTDGAPAMIRESGGSIGLCENRSRFPGLLFAIASIISKLWRQQ